MQSIIEKKREARQRRHRKIRSRVRGTAQMPRLSVFKSNRRILAQLIDDERGVTLLAAATLVNAAGKKNKTEAAREAGKALAEAALKAGIKAVAFDRGGFRYTGRVAALAEGARAGGLQV